ncbi:MAG: penicillin-binding protein 1B [Syntrophobacteria bacterium]
MFKHLKPPKKLVLILGLAGVIILAIFTIHLDFTVRTWFEGKRFKLPAKIYARALELYPDQLLSQVDLTKELGRLRYRKVSHTPQEQGTFRSSENALEIMPRPFVFADGFQEPIWLRVEFAEERVKKMSGNRGSTLTLARLDPPQIGTLYPGDYADRVLVRLPEVPEAVIHALLAAEDRRFYSHHGIDPRGITRAIFKTISGENVQGGSTLTQQLVKNLFLTPKKTIRRKFTEIIMALLLEAHYSKEEILETYINEVYLGQDGNRAVHGFGLAANFFFNKSLSELRITEAALLVGMLKGPIYFNPRSHAQRALTRRNLVLEQMASEGFLDKEKLEIFKAEPLAVIDSPPGGTSPHPAFINLVYRQLKRDYRDEDLRSEGLRVFTTLDPEVQSQAEKTLSVGLERLENFHKILSGSLQGAVIVTNPQNAEIKAVVGGRDPKFEGFNRALDAHRSIGSLIKPLVYLTALQQPENFTLATLLDDNPLVVKQAGTDDWTPQNYDKKYRGKVSLLEALVHSYNVPTVNLGMSLGIDEVMANLKRFGIEQELPEFASSLLGTNSFSPLEVTQIYQTIAGGGFYTPLRAIHAVLTPEGEALQRYPLNIEQVVDPAPLFLLTKALQDVVHEGTATALNSYLPADLNIAGKTGTSDEFRDSWFAGFTGNNLAVVWVGRDDNESMGLTGASGAMAIWGEMMTGLHSDPLILSQPDNIELAWIDPDSGLLSAKGCSGAVELPFIEGSIPTDSAACGPESLGSSIKGFFQRIFGQ